VPIDGVIYGGNGHNNGFPFALERRPTHAP
jgi:hypothetical protein